MILSFEHVGNAAVHESLHEWGHMIHDSYLRAAASERAGGSSFEEAALAHLKSLEDAGEMPEQIVRQLSDVAVSYAKDGLQDEASALREIVRQYQLKWTKDGASPS